MAIYETFARMSQNFINNLPLCEFHGSNGNQIIPEPSSSRYTEVRLSKAGYSMFDGIAKKNVPFVMNFDETIEMPELLPSPIPILFINGSEGIGTTIAQKFLPYDAKEITEAFKNYIETGEIDYTLVPSFPTGGTIINKNDAIEILKTGKGKVILRANAEVKKNEIIFTEICYQTYVRDLMEEFEKLYKNDELPGVRDILNLSGIDGIKIKFICEKDANPYTVLEMLYQKTNLQKTYSANQNLLIDKVPKNVNLADYFKLLLKHNDDCLIRELKYDEKKYLNIKEVNEGLLIATNSIDEVISIVRNSDNKDEAAARLIERFKLSDIQVDAILKMTISRLTKLDINDIKNKIEDAKNNLKQIEISLNDFNIRKVKITESINKILPSLPKERKTKAEHIVIEKKQKKAVAKIIEPIEDVVVILSSNNEIKRIKIEELNKLKKKTKKGTTNKEVIKEVLSCTTADRILCFTSLGKVHPLEVANIPSRGFSERGTSILNLLKLEESEKILLITEIKEDKEYISFFTKNGIVKKSFFSLFKDIKKSTKCITLLENDSLVSVNMSNNSNIAIITKNGKSIVFSGDAVSATGKTAKGVKGIGLSDGDEVVSGFALDKEYVTIISVSGLGKKISIDKLNPQGRGGKGVICSKEEVASAFCCEENDLLYVQGEKKSIITAVEDLPSLSQIAKGNIVLSGNRVVNAFKI